MNRYSDFSQRLFAYNLDITVLLVTFFLLSLWVKNDGAYYFLCFIITCVYHAALEGSSWEGTLGKRFSRMKVVCFETGERISFFRALIRILAKFISLAPCFVGFFMIYFRSDRRALHDLIAGTCVVQKIESESKDRRVKGNKV